MPTSAEINAGLRMLLTSDPNFTDYHAWDLQPEGAGFRVSCVCGWAETYTTKATAKAALRVHLA